MYMYMWILLLIALPLQKFRNLPHEIKSALMQAIDCEQYIRTALQDKREPESNVQHRMSTHPAPIIALPAS